MSITDKDAIMQIRFSYLFLFYESSKLALIRKLKTFKLQLPNSGYPDTHVQICGVGNIQTTGGTFAATRHSALCNNITLLPDLRFIDKIWREAY